MPSIPPGIHPHGRAKALPGRAFPFRPRSVSGRGVFLRRRLNLLNLSTPAGLLLARLTGCRIEAGPQQILLAQGYPLALPRAAAFTVGNVVLFPDSSARRIHAPDSPLLRHESRHSTQYAFLGPLFLPLYFAASALSLASAGNAASANPFERLAGLRDGGYRPAPRPAGRRTWPRLGGGKDSSK